MCFNSLQVGYKLWDSELTEERIDVSIPYRQATNIFISIYVFFITLYSFNSLQVGYKQRIRIYCRYQKDEFQFLIGRLQTGAYIPGMVLELFGVSIPYRQATNAHIRHINGDIITGFNSLQVGYKPVNEQCYVYKDGYVSIPYRQATNSSRAMALSLPCIGFNSLQVGYKHRNS